VVESRNEVITKRPISGVGAMPCEACVTRKRRASWHEPEQSDWAERAVKGVGERGEVLACLCGVETVSTICGGESGGKDYRLRAAPTAALLTATNDQGSHLGINCADQCGDAKRSANLGRAHNKMRSSGRLGVQFVVVCRLHRIDNECSTTRCAPCSRERCPRLDRAYFA